MSRNIQILISLSTGALGLVAGLAMANMSGPTEHKGLTVEALGKLEEPMIARQTGLDGYMMQLRAITIAPGGQIAQHSHENRPGLVKVISGEWIEGRPDAETGYAAEGTNGILEDGDTTHWFYNRGDTPATAIVCDLNPTG